MIIGIPANAQTSISKEMGNQYFDSCIAKEDPRLTEGSQAALCSCTTVKMMETMSVEDIQIMAQQSQAGRNKLNYMLINVYAPCMLYPVTDLVTEECLKDPKMGVMLLKMDKDLICGCIAEMTGEWLSVNSGDIIERLLKEDPNLNDVISPIMESSEFRAQSYTNLVACMK